jgi:hypothetical protein
MASAQQGQPTTYGVPVVQLAEERARWSWPARFWLGWWLLLGAGQLAAIVAAVDSPQAWLGWGAPFFVLSLLGGFVTLAPWLTWYACQRVRTARLLIRVGPYGTIPPGGWSAGAFFWLALEILMPLVGFLLLILAQNPQLHQAAQGFLVLWWLALVILFFSLLTWMRRRIRLARSMEASYLMNFTYNTHLPLKRRPGWRLLPLFDRSKVQEAYQVMEGKVGETPVTVLEWSDPDLAARTGRSSHLMVIVTEGIRLPAFELRPRRVAFFGGHGWALLLHLLHGPVGVVIMFLHWLAYRLSQSSGEDAREMSLDDEPDFKRRYQLFSHDEAATELLFTPSLCDLFLAEKADWLVQSSGGQLLLSNLRASSDPHQHPQIVAECLHLAHRLQETYVPPVIPMVELQEPVV